MTAKQPKTDAARLLAVRVVTEVVFEGANVGEAADRHLQTSGLSAEARAFASFLLYGTLTYWLPLNYQLNQLSHEPLETMSKYQQSVLIVGAFQLLYANAVPAYAAVNESVTLAGYFSGPKVKPLTNALLRRLAAKPPSLPRKAPGLRFGFSNELFGILRASYGEERALSIAAESTRVRPETPIRANRRRITAELPSDAFEPGVEVTPGSYADAAYYLHLKGRSPLTQPGWSRGLFSLQNESSQLAIETILALSPLRILELCGGNGGKTAAIAEKSDAALISVELDPTKLEQNRVNLSRLRLGPVTLVEADATANLTGVVGSPADLVFCDVPCSGLGVVAKKPEIRLRMTYDRIQALLPLQAAILREGSRQVKPGGHLFYFTCTHNRQENEAQAAAFLAEHSDFSAFSFASYLPAGATTSMREEAATGCLNLFGDGDGLDGFFIAAFTRSGGPI